ncbi:Trehalose 6-phosphate phosphatase [Psidium guajava]|nr:Trehalose 6-phosphate phosphatase [Psidium guajava]
MEGSTLCADNKVGTYTDIGKEKAKAEVTDGRLYGMADDLNGVKLVLAMTEEDNIVDQCFHERKHPMDGGMKKFQPIRPILAVEKMATHFP